MNQTSLIKKMVVSFLFFCLISVTLVQVRGNNFTGYTFGVKVGDSNTYHFSFINILQPNGTTSKEMFFYPYFNYTTTIHEGDSLEANITSINDGFLTYQLILVPQNRVNITSYNIDYNRPSDILLPLFYHFISTTNTTLIKEIINTQYRLGLSLNVSEVFISLKMDVGTSGNSRSLWHSVYNQTSGWASKLYYKAWNSTHIIAEYQIDEGIGNTKGSNGISWVSFPVLFFSLIFITIIFQRE